MTSQESEPRAKTYQTAQKTALRNHNPAHNRAGPNYPTTSKEDNTLCTENPWGVSKSFSFCTNHIPAHKD